MKMTKKQAKKRTEKDAAAPDAEELSEQELAGVSGGAGGQFTVESFSFGVERQRSATATPGGTADINIGVGELQECTISKG
jgi:bacteriocin-like protein